MASPKSRRIDKIPFDEHALARIADLLGGTVRLASFRLPDADVWQIDVPDSSGATAIVLTVWPSLHRVDASSSRITIVFTKVSGVELVEGVEVLFRRSNGEYLIVPIGGKVIVRA
jgi:hypothetical protein